jgi:hypothetical protein
MQLKSQVASLFYHLVSDERDYGAGRQGSGEALQHLLLY